MENRHQIDCVLLIDDDPISHFLNEEVLLDFGISREVKATDNIEDALNFINRCYQDRANPKSLLILLDLNMGFCNGLEFLDQISSKTEVAIEEIDVIVLSSVIGSSLKRIEKENVERYNIIGFIDKPLRPQNIKSVLDKKIKLQGVKNR